MHPLTEYPRPAMRRDLSLIHIFIRYGLLTFLVAAIALVPVDASAAYLPASTPSTSAMAATLSLIHISSSREQKKRRRTAAWLCGGFVRRLEIA